MLYLFQISEEQVVVFVQKPLDVVGDIPSIVAQSELLDNCSDYNTMLFKLGQDMYTCNLVELGSGVLCFEQWIQTTEVSWPGMATHN